MVYDVIGIGALNIDYIATRTKLLSRDPSALAEISERFEAGSERNVSLDELREVKSLIGDAYFETWLGGSTFNVIQALRSAAPELKLGYVGSTGPDPQGKLPFLSWFADHQVDCRYVHNATPLGTAECLSFIQDGERSLLTTRGANDGLAVLLKRHAREVVDYLSKARCIHLTSFFDADTPKLLLDILVQVKERNTGVILSFDPGHQWCRDHTTSEPIRGLLRLSDILFVNTEEFRLLAGTLPAGTDETVMANRIISKCNDNTSVIFQKNYDRITLFFRVFRRGVVRRDFSNEVLPVQEIEDATGAGDVFAAGVLLGQLVPGLQIEESVRLALRMVRRKLIGGGARNFNRFLGLVEEVTDEVSGTKQEKAIFIGHGRDPVWRQIQTHLTQTLGLKVKAWESESRVNQYPINVLSEALDSASFAILLLTGEDESEAGRLRARQNVLHEMGLFQGRLGFNKVIVVRDADIEVPSNIEGWQSVLIHRDDLRTTLDKLDEGLRAAKVI